MNFSSDKLPSGLDWSSSQRLSSLKSLFNFSDNHCSKAIEWYYHKKSSKQKLGAFLRILAITAVAVAGIMPVISEIICKTNQSQCSISPAWATVCLAVAALCIALDRFAGYTSAWVRYVRSAQRLTELQGQFRMDWYMYLYHEMDYSLAKEVDPRKVILGIRLCKKYISDVNLVVRNETDAWAQEFQQALVQFDSSPNQAQVIQETSLKEDPEQRKVTQSTRYEASDGTSQVVQELTFQNQSGQKQINSSSNKFSTAEPTKPS